MKNIEFQTSKAYVYLKRISILFLMSFLIIESALASNGIRNNFGIPGLGGNFKTGVKSTTLIEPLTLRPLVLYFFYPSQDSLKAMTLESFGLINIDRISNWKKTFSPIENIDLPWTINFLTEIHKYGKLNSTQDSKPVAAKFPILFFQPGATGSTQDYTFLLEQLASYGIIILSIDRPIAEGVDKLYFLPSDNKYIKYNAKDDRDKYDYLLQGANYTVLLNAQIIENLNEIMSAQQLNFDVDNVFVSGHSMGGDGAFRSSKKINNVKGYINFDGSIDGSNENHFDFNKNFYLLESNCASCDLKNDPTINKEISDKMNHLFVTTKNEGFDHGSIGNNPIYVENSPSGKGFSLSSNFRGQQKTSETIFREISKWVMTILNHF